MVIQDLIRIPSRNMPPIGEEGACQEYIVNYLAAGELPATCTNWIPCRAW